MTNEKSGSLGDGIEPDRIDLNSAHAVSEWARKFDSTEMQIRDAITEVGNRATDVEMHLKGTRSTTNTERVDEVVPNSADTKK